MIPIHRAALVAFVAAFTCPTLARAAVVDRIAAVVNDQVITLSEVYEIGSDFIGQTCATRPTDKCRYDAEIEVLEPLIRRKLMKQELVELGYDISASDVDALIQDVVRQYDFPDRDALRAEVEKSGITWDAYRDQLAEARRGQIFQEVILRNRVTIGEDELRDQYQRLIRTLDTTLVAKLDGFAYVLPADATATQRESLLAEFGDVLESVRKGKRTWQSVIDEYDTAGAAAVFAEQVFARGQLQPALEGVVFEGALGMILDPVATERVIYGVRVLSREETTPDAPPFDEVKDQLSQTLFREKLEDAEKEWFEVAKRQAAIDVLLPPPEE